MPATVCRNIMERVYATVPSIGRCDAKIGIVPVKSRLCYMGRIYTGSPVLWSSIIGTPNFIKKIGITIMPISVRGVRRTPGGKPRSAGGVSIIINLLQTVSPAARRFGFRILFLNTARLSRSPSRGGGE